MIFADVADMQKDELQMTTRKMLESRKENETLKRKNEALKLVIEQLTTQLDEQNKLLVIQNEEAQLLRREAGRVHVERQQTEFNAFSGLDWLIIIYFLLNCNR